MYVVTKLCLWVSFRHKRHLVSVKTLSGVRVLNWITWICWKIPAGNCLDVSSNNPRFSCHKHGWKTSKQPVQRAGSLVSVTCLLMWPPGFTFSSPDRRNIRDNITQRKSPKHALKAIIHANFNYSWKNKTHEIRIMVKEYEEGGLKDPEGVNLPLRCW